MIIKKSPKETVVGIDIWLAFNWKGDKKGVKRGEWVEVENASKNNKILNMWARLEKKSPLFYDSKGFIKINWGVTYVISVICKKCASTPSRKM